MASERLFSSPVCVLDTETTGLLQHPDARPLELAAVLLDTDGREIASFEAMMRPDPFPEERWVQSTLNYLGLHRAMIEDAEPARVVLRRWDDWWYSAGKPALTAFNVAFDRPMLKRAGWAPVAPETPLWTGWPWARCVMGRASAIMGASGELEWFSWKGEYRYPKLEHAAAFFGVEQQLPAHRALADARTAALVACAIARRGRP